MDWMQAGSEIHRQKFALIHCSLLESKMFTQFCINSQGANSIQVQVTDSH